MIIEDRVLKQLYCSKSDEEPSDLGSVNPRAFLYLIEKLIPLSFV